MTEEEDPVEMDHHVNSDIFTCPNCKLAVMQTEARPRVWVCTACHSRYRVEDPVA